MPGTSALERGPSPKGVTHPSIASKAHELVSDWRHVDPSPSHHSEGQALSQAHGHSQKAHQHVWPV